MNAIALAQKRQVARQVARLTKRVVRGVGQGFAKGGYYSPLLQHVIEEETRTALKLMADTAALIEREACKAVALERAEVSGREARRYARKYHADPWWKDSEQCARLEARHIADKIEQRGKSLDDSTGNSSKGFGDVGRATRTRGFAA